jgi:hypothetical protein
VRVWEISPHAHIYLEGLHIQYKSRSFFYEWSNVHTKLKGYSAKVKSFPLSKGVNTQFFEKGNSDS